MGDHLISGSWDCTIKIWKLSSANTNFLPIFDCTENDSRISSVDISIDGNIAISGTNEGNLLFFDRRENHLLNSSFRSFVVLIFFILFLIILIIFYYFLFLLFLFYLFI